MSRAVLIIEPAVDFSNNAATHFYVFRAPPGANLEGYINSIIARRNLSDALLQFAAHVDLAAPMRVGGQVDSRVLDSLCNCTVMELYDRFNVYFYQVFGGLGQLGGTLMRCTGGDATIVMARAVMPGVFEENPDEYVGCFQGLGVLDNYCNQNDRSDDDEEGREYKRMRRN